MGKTINLTTKDGQKYTLEFTKKSIKEMEANGFRIDKLNEMPITAVSELFAGAFIAHHKFLKKNVVEELFNGITKKEDLFATLVEMYTEPYSALMNDPEDGEGNVSWEVSN